MILLSRGEYKPRKDTLRKEAEALLERVGIQARKDFPPPAFRRREAARGHRQGSHEPAANRLLRRAHGKPRHRDGREDHELILELNRT